MNQEQKDTIRYLAYIFALENAVKHGGKANPQAVMGKVISYLKECGVKIG